MTSGRPSPLPFTALSSLPAVLLVIVFTTIVLRLAMPAPIIVPDSRFFSKLADNLITNQCYSTSPVASAECKPSWGSQPPGYPLFLALVKLVSGPDPMNVVIAQTSLYALAAVYALWACYTWHGSKAILPLSGGLMALSPVLVAWSRWLLTETLTAAVALCLFALLFRSLATRRLHVVGLALGMPVAALMRWDQLWLLAPIAVCAFSLERAATALRHVAVITLAAATPGLLLVARAAIVGLPLLPSLLSDPGIPRGVVSFWQNAAVTQNATAGFLWPIWSREYGGFAGRFDYGSIRPAFDTPEFRTLMQRMETLPRHTRLPTDIDHALSRLAATGAPEGRDAQLRLVIQRFLAMWLDRDLIFFSGRHGLAYQQPAEGVAHAYRVTLLLLALTTPFLVPRAEAMALGGALLYVILRSLALAALCMLEIRYLTPALPLLEVTLPPMLARGLLRSREKRPVRAVAQPP